MNDQKYSTLYNISLSISYNKTNIITIVPADIVSIAIMNNYDNMTFPVIRIRLYTDVSVMQRIAEFPDSLIIRGNLDGSIYRMPQNMESSPQRMKPTPSIYFKGLKGYIRQKNIATSSMDQYVQGVKREIDLNSQTKVPIEILCYDETMVGNMRTQTPSIYKNVSVEYVLKFMLENAKIPLRHIDIIENQIKYDQFLIPNLEVIDAFSFIDDFYGLYKKGGQLFCDIDGIYITNTAVAYNKPLAIHVRSTKSNDDMSGLRKFGNNYLMGTMATNVSIMSESDLQKVIQSSKMSAVDLNDYKVKSTNMIDMFNGSKYTDWNDYTVPHKSKNQFITDMYKARVDEKNTIVSVSGNGFEISPMKINSRYNLIWESPQRGQDINKIYRPVFINHVFSNLDSKLFLAETTMNLVSN